MKKLLSVFMSLFFMTPLAISSYASENPLYPYKTEDVFVRDPYILVYDGLYYMYGTGLATVEGYGCRVSPDLINWSEPYNVFVNTDSFDAAGDFWAPECHYYKGSFYLFASYRSETTGFRGTSVFKASSPLGPFTEISDGHITPHGKDHIDGTLYIDEDGKPWMAYVNEWTSAENEIGRMSVVRLSDDLTSTVGEPKEIFTAHDAPWNASAVTDGPFLYRTEKGSLLMLWSTFSHEGYCVGIARSDNGKPDGNWTQELTRLYSRAFYYDRNNAFDGGHPMLFTSLEGDLMLAVHSPNSPEGEGDSRVSEHAVFFKMEEKNDTLRIEKFYCFNRFKDLLTTILNRIADLFENLTGINK